MPAPRLLDKKLVNASLATERKQEIEKGVKLAKAIDALQETKAKETQDLEEFRINTLKSIQIQIDAKVAENTRFDLETKRLKEERLIAEAPIDLKEEWMRVRELGAANESWQDKNTQDSIDILAREESNRLLSQRLENEEHEIQEEHDLSRRTLSEAEQKHLLAAEALERAERQAQDILKNAQQIENRVKVREEDATFREMSLSKREKEVDAHEIDLSNREIKLKSRQETFMRAQKYITSKRK